MGELGERAEKIIEVAVEQIQMAKYKQKGIHIFKDFFKKICKEDCPRKELGNGENH